jgi:hypothetical protein
MYSSLQPADLPVTTEEFGDGYLDMELARPRSRSGLIHLLYDVDAGMHA